MYVDTLQIADNSEITRHVLDSNKRGTQFPASPSDGDVFELTESYNGNPPAIYKYVSAESKWIATHPNFDMLPYDVSGAVFGNMNDEDVLMRHIAVRSYRLKQGFLNCLAAAISAATVDTYLTIIHQGRNGIETELGKLVFMASETVGVFQQTGTGDMMVTAGEILLVKAPLNVNQELSDISFTFAGALI